MDRGFTLTELVITIGISVLISSLVLANFPDFARRLELSRTAQAVAFSFRQAESAALAVREFSSDVFPAYGLHFDALPGKSYVLFADVDKDYDIPVAGTPFYDGEAERADTFVINTLPSLTKICAGAASSPPGDCSISWADIVYVRPNPDIYIWTDKGSFTDIGITIGLPTGEERQIIIWTTGQLTIE